MSLRNRMITMMLISFMFAFMSGGARGFHHASRDYHNESKAAVWFDKDWYDGVGGKEVWNQSYPWTADFTHTMMHLQVLGLVLAGIMLIWWSRIYAYRKVCVCPRCVPFIYLFSWSTFWGFMVWFIEGRGFTLPYHVILPNADYIEQYSFWVWLIGWVGF